MDYEMACMGLNDNSLDLYMLIFMYVDILLV